MADILFVTWDGGGNVPPAAGASPRELQARGHAVRFLGHAAQREALTAAGVEVGAHPARAVVLRPRRHSPLALLAAFGDRGMGRDLLDAVAERPADLVVVDCLMFGALDAPAGPACGTSCSSTSTTPTTRGLPAGPAGPRAWPCAGCARAGPWRPRGCGWSTTLPALDAAGPAVRQVGPVVGPWSPRVAPAARSRWCWSASAPSASPG